MLAGAAVSWTSRLQDTVALSSVESEYIAVSTTAQEQAHLQQLLKDLNIPQNGSTTVYQDNQGAMHLAMNDATTRRSKHIDIRYHFIRQQVEKKMIKLEYLPTNEMTADFLTKASTKKSSKELSKKPLEFKVLHICFEGACQHMIQIKVLSNNCYQPCDQ